MNKYSYISGDASVLQAATLEDVAAREVRQSPQQVVSAETARICLALAAIKQPVSQNLLK